MNKTVVFITSRFPFGKSEVWINNELKSLIDLGYDILVAPRSSRGKSVNNYFENYRDRLIVCPLISFHIILYFVIFICSKPKLVIKVLRGIYGQSNKLSDFFRSIMVLPKSFYLVYLLRHVNVGHIHAYSSTSCSVMAYIISEILKVDWSYTLHSSSIINSRYEKSFRFRHQSAKFCRTVSHITKDDLKFFLGDHSSNKIVTAHLGIDTSLYDESIKPENTPLILATIGELKSHKGHIYAFETARRLLDDGVNNFIWKFYGSGPLEVELSQKIKELGLKSHCKLHGNIPHEDLICCFANQEIDIVVSPSISVGDVFEGIQVSLMEAMSFALPVVATDCGSTRELVDGNSGILVPEKSVNDLYHAIKTLLQSQSKRTEFGNAGRVMVEHEFDTLNNSLTFIGFMEGD